MIRTYRQLPEIVSGYTLDDIWSVVVPVARTNLITNPSFETATTSWTAIGGSIARSTTYQYHGAYSLAITPTATTTDGVRYDTVSLTSGTTYAFHMKVRGVAGLKYKIAIETTGGVELTSVTFTASGRWQWIYGYYTETSSTTRRVTARKAGHASVTPFYIDGVQVETIASGETWSTYIDGDQLGMVPNQQPAAYFWNGTPHASTSTRSALTRAGGMVVPFKKYGFLLTAIIGLGLAQPQNVATEYARIDGGYDDYTRKPTRQFTLTGRFQGRTYAQLRDQRGRLARLFDRDLVAQDQRLILLRHVEDGSGQIVSTTARIPAKYETGLGGSTDNHTAETAPITFTQYLANVLADGESGAALNVQTSIASGANGVLQRSPAGVWSAMGTGASGGSAVAIKQGLNGLIYVGGSFTSMGGVANTSRIAVWDPVAGSWAALGTGAAGGSVTELAVMPNGDVVAAGTFTSMGGVANTNKIARWNGSAWSSISSGFTGTDIRGLAVSPAGILYAGGTFSNIGGTAAANIASYNGSAWSALGAGSANPVLALLAVNSRVYLMNDTVGVQYWNGSTYTTIDSSAAGVEAFAVDQAGNIYAAGGFSSIGGVTAANIAKWNGVAWSPLGSGLGSGIVFADSLFRDVDGSIWAGGTFTSAGGITTPSGVARWNGSAWVYPDIIPGGTVQVVGGLSLPSGQLYINTSNNGTAIYGGTTTITNAGTARAYPTIVINGPSSGTARIYSITNPTTSRSIYLNLTISAGETVRMVFQPDNLSFVSTFQGDVAGSILPGSNTADFFLQPGANSIALLSGSSTVVATMYWRPAFASLDDVP